MSIFPFSRTAAAPRPSLLARLVGRPDVAAASAALERTLAESWPSPTRASVISVLRAHRVADVDARTICVALFAKALAAFADAEAISGHEALHLRVLHAALGLAARDIAEAHRQVAEAIYGAALARALDQENLTPDERARLDALVSHLRDSPDRRGVLHREQAQSLLQHVLGTQSPRRLLTQQEVGTMRAMAEKFATQIDFGAAARAQFDRFELLWRIENGELPAIAVRIKLLKGEVCHFYAAARWLERPTAATHDSDSGGAPPIRVVKGVSYRVPGQPTRRIEQEGAVEIDRGRLYITNKRFIFDGPRKQAAIRHSDVVALEVYADGFRLEKAMGTFPLLSFDVDSAMATAMAAEAMARA